MKLWKLCTALMVTVGIAASAGAQNKPATPISVGKTLEFAMERDETKDLGIQLAKGGYYIQVDMQLAGTRPTNMIMQIDLHKTNGVVVQTSIITANEIDKAARVGKVFRVAAPGAYRLRVKNQCDTMTYWVTVMPEKDKKPNAYAWEKIEWLPLGIGTNNGKGGTLEPMEEEGWDAYHAITLEPGKYMISLYLAHPEDISTNLQAQVEMYDAMGMKMPSWSMFMNEIGKESRIEKALILAKPTKVYLRVKNVLNKPVNYIVGIEKA